MLDAAEAAPIVSPADAAAESASRPALPDAAAVKGEAEPANAIKDAPVDKDHPTPESWATWWLTDRDALVFTVLSAVLLVLIAYRWAVLSGWGAHEIEIERQTPLAYNFQLDPNTASWVELAQLDGVGETLALRITEDRETNGPFRTLEDLDRVKGVGAKTIERLRPYLHIGPMDHAQH